jgi:hypothetical protein
MPINLNDVGEQRAFEVIPAGQIVRCAVKIRPGGIGEGGWLCQAVTEKGTSQNLDCEFTVIDGSYKSRKLWQKYTLSGEPAATFAESARISLEALKALIESAKGIKAGDKSETATAARNIDNWGELNGAVVTVKLGVKAAEGNYAAKNSILFVLTPANPQWAAPTAEEAAAAATAATINAAAEPTQQDAPTPTATAIATPNWAK